MITSFSKEYRFLSNFFPCFVKLDGITYASVEHAYQAAKTLDPKEREHIRSLSTPGQAKRAGKTLRPDWERVKIRVMEHLLRQKFSQERFKAWLLDTGTEHLMEGNEWGDKYWGCVWTSSGWSGENWLGKLLMYIREELKND